MIHQRKTDSNARQLGRSSDLSDVVVGKSHLYIEVQQAIQFRLA